MNPTDRIILYPADLVLVEGAGWLSETIRQCEQGPGEAPSRASHVGGVLAESSMTLARIVEALSTVQVNDLATYRGTPIRIVRHAGLTWAKRLAIVASVERQIGCAYPWGQIACHALDAGLAKLGHLLTLGLWKPQPPVIFRHLASIDPTNICSTLWARAYAKHGLAFGAPDFAAQPDDIDDHATPANGWATVWEWAVYPKGAA